MNGFSNSKRMVYVNIYKGTFCVEVADDDPTGLRREKKSGKVVKEHRFDTFFGTLEDIKLEDGDYGRQWIFHMTDGKDNYLFRLPLTSRITNGFLFRLPNINLTQPFKIRLFWFEAEERSACILYQDGKKIEPAFTREDPAGLPELVPVKINGKDTYDASERIEFLEHLINTEIRPALADNRSLNEIHPEEDDKIDTEDIPVDDDYDLPF